MPNLRSIINDQKAANKASLKFAEYFTNHKQTLTEQIRLHYASEVEPDAHTETKTGRLCILGAGNCYDVDLELLAGVFKEIHLVDIDKSAIEGARNRLKKSFHHRIFLHGGIDISCANKKLESWRDMSVGPEDLINFPDKAVSRITSVLPGPFDVVVSACLASQLLFSYKNTLGDDHPLFEAGLITLLSAHMRILAGLTASKGHALFVSDVSSNEIAALDQFDPNNEGLNFLHQQEQAQQVFTYLAPNVVDTILSQDPFIQAKVKFSPPLKAWLWQNGPLRTFLVYMLKLSKI